jgi:hypothetical protein
MGIKNKTAAGRGLRPTAVQMQRDRGTRRNDRGEPTRPGDGLLIPRADAASKAPGPFQIFAVRADDLLRLVTSAAGNPTLAVLARLIFDLLRKADRALPGAGSVCLFCDYEFLASTLPPAVFVVSIPFAQTEGTAMTSALCEKCADKLGNDGAIIDAAVESYRAVFPRAQVIEWGQA